nr:MAG TPA: G-protein coupled receptor [Caudoviricetes sp.]
MKMSIILKFLDITILLSMAVILFIIVWTPPATA